MLLQIFFYNCDALKGDTVTDVTDEQMTVIMPDALKSDGANGPRTALAPAPTDTVGEAKATEPPPTICAEVATAVSVTVMPEPLPFRTSRYVCPSFTNVSPVVAVAAFAVNVAPLFGEVCCTVSNAIAFYF